jgi:hypothetical protein
MLDLKAAEAQLISQRLELENVQRELKRLQGAIKNLPSGKPVIQKVIERVVTQAPDAVETLGVSLNLSGIYTASNTTWLTLIWDFEVFDDGGFHTYPVNGDKIIVPVGKGGRYLVGGSVGFAANATGSRGVALLVNTVMKAYQLVGPGDAVGVNAVGVTKAIELAAGDYLQLQAFQSSGGNLNISTFDFATAFWAVKVG